MRVCCVLLNSPVVHHRWAITSAGRFNIKTQHSTVIGISIAALHHTKIINKHAETLLLHIQLTISLIDRNSRTCHRFFAIGLIAIQHRMNHHLKPDETYLLIVM